MLGSAYPEFSGQVFGTSQDAAADNDRETLGFWPCLTIHWWTNRQKETITERQTNRQADRQTKRGRVFK